MKHLFLSTLFSLMTLLLLAQRNARLSLEVNYGLQGNFFVRSYTEYAPGSAKALYKKNFIGTIGGLELKYKLNPFSNISLGYSKSINKREINYTAMYVSILHFRISHINNFYQLGYERVFSKRNMDIKFNSGIFYLRMKQQEVDASPVGVSLEERDYKHNKPEEGGAFFGLHYSKKIDTKFELGIKSRVYYLISTNQFEAITLTPTLTYNF